MIVTTYVPSDDRTNLLATEYKIKILYVNRIPFYEQITARRMARVKSTPRKSVKQIKLAKTVQKRFAPVVGGIKKTKRFALFFFFECIV